MIDFSTLDFTIFEDVPAPTRFYDRLRLTLTTDGVLTMNRALLAAVGENRRFSLQLSPDGRLILLQANPNGSICFSGKGTVTHNQLKEMLVKRGIQLPAVYLLEWCEGKGLWVGSSRDLPQPPSAEQMLPEKRRKGTKHS